MHHADPASPPLPNGSDVRSVASSGLNASVVGAHRGTNAKPPGSSPHAPRAASLLKPGDPCSSIIDTALQLGTGEEFTVLSCTAVHAGTPAC